MNKERRRKFFATESAIDQLYQKPVRLLSNGIVKKIEFSFSETTPGPPALIAYYNYPDDLPLYKRKRFYHIALYATHLDLSKFDITDNRSFVNFLEKEISSLIKKAVDEWEWFYDRYAFWS